MNVLLTPAASKQLTKLPRVTHSRIFRKLIFLKENPFVGKSLKRNLKAHYSLRAWPYRILYTIIKNKQIILVTAIEHRQGVYK
ncbi:MAG: RelE, Cytotoxic translational repressor of toxin-antitoxin stability system [Microgenomates group bacterium GW2011_GWC1_49_7]|nr:MAG: RelE, Cytotoxic translational repressor of toxin-antitoxin stability system [Microgenomates group bacterium GW2011_GWC1_49_7]